MLATELSHVVDLIPPDRWSHVNGADNPADCASRGVLPLELIDHPLWWTGPDWLQLNLQCWPPQEELLPNLPAIEADEICLHSLAVTRGASHFFRAILQLHSPYLELSRG